MKSVKSACQSSGKNKNKVDKNDEKAGLIAELSLDDPLSLIVTLFDKKIRSLEKRKTKALALKKQVSEGKNLNDDQLATANQHDEIVTKIDFAKEMQDYLSFIHSEFRKMKNPNSISNLDPITAAKHEAVSSLMIAMDVLSNSSLYIERLNIINSVDDNDPISRSDVNVVVKFKRLVDVNNKKSTFHHQNLVSKLPKLINKEINMTYEQLMNLIIKIHDKVKNNATSQKEVHTIKEGPSNVLNGVIKDFVKSENENARNTPVMTTDKIIDLIEIVEKSVETEVWHDYNRSNNEKRNSKDRRNDASLSNSQVRNNRPSGGYKNRNPPNNQSVEVDKVVNERTQIIIKDVKINDSGQRNNNRRFDSQSGRTSDYQGYRDGYSSGGPRNNNYGARRGRDFRRQEPNRQNNGNNIEGDTTVSH